MSATPPGTQALWLSIHPVFTDAILSGRKRVEFRKARPNVPSGSLVVCYSTTPVRSITGLFILEEVETAHPELLWKRHETVAAVDQKLYFEYYRGAADGVALHIGRIWKLDQRIPLSSVRKKWPGFRPPQSFRYVLCQTYGTKVSLNLDQNGPEQSVILEVGSGYC